MNRILLIFMMLCLYTFSYAQNVDLDAIRKDFKNAVKDENLCEKHYELLKKNAKSETEKGYEAAYQMFMGKHTSNPFKKMGYFNGGKGLLEKQIKTSPENVELRFIRLCIQYHLPKYLGYRGNIDEDKAFMVNNLYRLKDNGVKVVLFNYLKGANMYSAEELVLLGR